MLNMKKAKIIESIGSYLNLENRLKLVEDFLNANAQDSYQSVLRSIKSKEKCRSSYSKIELAQLFYILMDEGLLFFEGADEKENRRKFQVFVVNNFTYSGYQGTQMGMKSISKQFSESKGFTYKEKQIKFLADFITRMQERKKRLEKW